MLRKIALLIILIASTVSTTNGQVLKLQITEPANNTKVPVESLVRGTAGNSEAIIWIIVHPIGTPDYWVQPRVTMNTDNRTWNTTANIGRAGKDVGKEFEIIAVANPEKELKEGDILDEWPKAKSRSEIIKVTRK